MFTVAIIGRPNVGKSTMFNRFVGQKVALVDDTPGVTRDRRYGLVDYKEGSFYIVDTAGFETAKDDSLPARMRQQMEIAIDEANICLFVIDGREGVTAYDMEIAQLLRKKGKKVIPVCNKAESPKNTPGLFEVAKLGFGEPVAFSAEHGVGFNELMQMIFAEIPDDTEEYEATTANDEAGVDRPLKLAIIGRPNAGKSTLINTILQEERLLTGPEAGITRDTIAVDYNWQGKKITLYDTAGMRKKAKVQAKLEKLSVGDTLRAIQFAEVVVLLVDVTMPFEKQDMQIAQLVEREGRAIVIAMNKWDQVENPDDAAKFLRDTGNRLFPQIKGVPIVIMSGLSGRGIDKLMKAVFDVYKTWNTRISTAKLNAWLEKVTETNPAPVVNGRRLKIKYMTQIKTRPPTFLAFMTRPEKLPDSYTRYLVNSMRETFNLPAVPIRISMRKEDNPYVDEN